MVSNIARFRTYEEIVLRGGQLGYCLANGTLYIGTTSGAFAPISAGDESFAEIMEALNDLTESIAAAREEATTALKGHDERTNSHPSIQSELESLQDELEALREEIHKKTTYFSPDYARIGPEEFNLVKEYVAMADGYVLIAVNGPGGFAINIGSVLLYEKAGVHTNDPDTDSIFAQVYQVAKGQRVLVTGATVTASCKFIPLKVGS